MKRENVIMGTMILSASSIFVRLIGFLFRIYLSNTMGAEGIGVYSLIMSLYGLCATVAVSGISTAVSKMAAEELARGNRANAKRVLRRATTLALGISSVVAVAVFAFATPIAELVLKDPRTILSLRLMAPGMPFLSLSACVRGYFIAERHMGNPASGQVLEQLVKMGFIMALIGYWLPRGIEYGCAIVVLGITVGEVVCLLYTLLGYLLERRKYPHRGRADIGGVTRGILHIALPISMGSYIRSALRLVEDVLVLSGFKKFSGQDDVATGTYGMLKGMVMPMLIFPLSLLSAFVVTLTPEVSRLNAMNNPKKLERAISTILKYTSLIGILIVAVFMCFSRQIGLVVYKDAQVGEMLRLLSFLCPFMCIEMVVVGILQGLGEQVSSMRYNVADCFLRIALVYALIPFSGVRGFMVMVVASNLFTSLLNLRRLLKITRLPIALGDWIVKPAIAALAAGQGALAAHNYLFQGIPMWQGLTLGVLLTTGAYLLILMGLGCVEAGDMAWIVRRLKFSAKPPRTVPEQIG